MTAAGPARPGADGEPTPGAGDAPAPGKGAATTEEARAEEATTISPKLLEVLVCPATGGRLTYDRERGELVSKAARLAYPIRSGIPIMLIDEARKLED